MSDAISGLLGAIVGGLAAIGGAWLQARSAAKLQRQEAAGQEEQRRAERTALLQERRQLLARRYLYQLLSALAEAVTARRTLDQATGRLDGKNAAASTARRHRTILANAMDYAVELGHLETNPIRVLKWTAPKVSSQVDRRSVVNPRQARALLDAVRDQQPTRIGHREPQITASGRIQLHNRTESKIATTQRFRRSKPLSRGFEEWGGWGSNPRPTDYESAALTG
jgi:hypothetical protein